MKKKPTEKATPKPKRTGGSDDRAANVLAGLLKPFPLDGWGYERPTLGIAERRAKAFEEDAEWFAKQGHKKLSEERRAAAAEWRGMMNLPPDQSDELYSTWEMNAREAIDALLAHAETREGPYLRIDQLLSALLGGLHALAANGRDQAVSLLLNSLYGTVESFEKLATRDPDIFRSRVRGAFGIPAIVSPSSEKTKDNARLIKQLNVGETYHLAILPTGKKGKHWQFQEGASGWASRLQSYVAHHRTLYALHSETAKQQNRTLPKWLSEASRLKPFSKSCAQ